MRKGFNSRFGIIAAAAGSAVGLGNIWRFPYVAGQNGGAAFILIYMLIMFLIGLPMLVTELSLGRHSQRNVFGTFRFLAPKTKWYLVGVLGIISCFTLLSFYIVVAGWTIHALVDSLFNNYSGLSTEQVREGFATFSEGGGVSSFIYMAIFLVITSGVVSLGVEKGIEKCTKFLMPVLVLILIAMSIYSFFLDGWSEGLHFIFEPDFSQINSNVVVSALGQVFLSLSIGQGTMLTYGSYMKKEFNMFRTSSTIVFSDLIIAILAGIAIFPAVFTFGIAPESGPNLVFITLPAIFSQMAGGQILAILFFFLLFAAALTSAISALEVIVAYMVEELKWKRTTSTAVTTLLILILGALCNQSLVEGSNLSIGGVSFFSICDIGSASYIMPIGGLFIMLYAGWKFAPQKLKEEVESQGLHKLQNYKVFHFIVKYVVPLVITVVFFSLLGLI